MSKQLVRVVQEYTHHVVTCSPGGGGGAGLSGLDEEHIRLFIHGGSASYTGNVIDCDGTTTKILDCGDAYL